MGIYSVNLRIHSEYRKIRTRNNSVFGQFSCSVSASKLAENWEIINILTLLFHSSLVSATSELIKNTLYHRWNDTAHKMMFSIKDFFSKCDQILRKLCIWSHLVKKSLMENFIFCAVWDQNGRHHLYISAIFSKLVRTMIHRNYIIWKLFSPVRKVHFVIQNQ